MRLELQIHFDLTFHLHIVFLEFLEPISKLLFEPETELIQVQIDIIDNRFLIFIVITT